MSQTLAANDFNKLLIQKTLMEQKIKDLQNELTHHIDILNTINSILESCTREVGNLNSLTNDQMTQDNS
jgi:hypothetical protein